MNRIWKLALVSKGFNAFIIASRHETQIWKKHFAFIRPIYSSSFRRKADEEPKKVEDDGFSELNKVMELKIKPSEMKSSKVTPSKYAASFEKAVTIGKTKEGFYAVIDAFLESDRSRRGHMEFLKTAVTYMEEFGVSKDVEAYNKMLNVFPRGRYENRTLFDAIWAKKHPQAELAIDILTEMEDHWIQPNIETYDILYDIFGHASQPLQKCRRLIYWYDKMEEMFPNPYPKVLPDSDVEISHLAINRMSKDEQFIVVYQDNSENTEQEFLVGTQTKEQQKVLSRYSPDKQLYVEGPFFMWVRRLQRYFFTLRTDVEEDDENNEGKVVAICMSHANASEEVLRAWITNLQGDNPQLANISVIFNLNQTPQ